MEKKTPGKLNSPPTQENFDKLPLEDFCRLFGGIFYRLHAFNAKTGKPWSAIHFSCKGSGRFDPIDGVGTLYIAEALGGALMEKFDDRWGPVGSLGRSITEQELCEWWVTLIHVPKSKLVEVSGKNLSLLGTDTQLVTGDYATAGEWALRFMRHPLQIAGIYYPSRHDNDRFNVALFRRPHLLDQIEDADLLPANVKRWKRRSRRGLVYGPPVLLKEHPETESTLRELKVATLP